MRTSILAVALLFLAGGEAAAQTRGDLNEVSLSAFLSTVSAGGESSTIMQLESRYGRFLTSRLELGASLSATKVEGIDLFGTLGAFGAWHFGLEGATSVPYAGAGAGFGFGGGDDNPVNFGVFGGGKFFVGESAAVHTELFVNRIDSGTGNGTQYGLRVGLAIFW
jgi:hypothetical protein